MSQRHIMVLKRIAVTTEHGARSHRTMKVGKLYADSKQEAEAIASALSKVEGVETRSFVRVYSHSAVTRFVDIASEQDADELIQDIRAAFDM